MSFSLVILLLSILPTIAAVSQIAQKSSNSAPTKLLTNLKESDVSQTAEKESRRIDHIDFWNDRANGMETNHDDVTPHDEDDVTRLHNDDATDHNRDVVKLSEKLNDNQDDSSNRDRRRELRNGSYTRNRNEQSSRIEKLFLSDDKATRTLAVHNTSVDRKRSDDFHIKNLSGQILAEDSELNNERKVSELVTSEAPQSVFSLRQIIGAQDEKRRESKERSSQHVAFENKEQSRPGNMSKYKEQSRGDDTFESKKRSKSNDVSGTKERVRRDDMSELKRAFNAWGGKRNNIQSTVDGKCTSAFDISSSDPKLDLNERGIASKVELLNEDNADLKDAKRSFNAWGGKRAFNAWGGKRAFNAWGGKRKFQAWGGKRAFNAWGGKRALNNEGSSNRAQTRDEQPEEKFELKPEDLMGETVKKDEDFASGVSDSDSEEKRIPKTSNIRRAFNAWGGKRAFNAWGGKRVFNAWGGKRNLNDLRENRKTETLPKSNTYRVKRDFSPWGGKRALLAPRSEFERQFSRNDDVMVADAIANEDVPYDVIHNHFVQPSFTIEET